MVFHIADFLNHKILIVKYITCLKIKYVPLKIQI